MDLSAIGKYKKKRLDGKINELKGMCASSMCANLCVFLRMTACTEGAGCGFNTMFIFLAQLPMKPPTNQRK